MKRILTAAALMLTPAQTAAQALQCAPKEKVFVSLSMQHHERLDGVGLARDGEKIMVWVNWVTRSWTIVLVKPNGQACIMANGSDWTADRTPPGEPL